MAPIAPETRIRRRDDVAHHDLDEGGVLLHLGSGEYHGVNDVGRLVWELLAEERTVAELVAGVRERVEAPPELEADVLRFLEELARRELVEVVPA